MAPTTQDPLPAGLASMSPELLGPRQQRALLQKAHTMARLLWQVPRADADRFVSELADLLAGMPRFLRAAVDALACGNYRRSTAANYVQFAGRVIHAFEHVDQPVRAGAAAGGRSVYRWEGGFPVVTVALLRSGFGDATVTVEDGRRAVALVAALSVVWQFARRTGAEASVRVEEHRHFYRDARMIKDLLLGWGDAAEAAAAAAASVSGRGRGVHLPLHTTTRLLQRFFDFEQFAWRTPCRDGKGCRNNLCMFNHKSCMNKCCADHRCSYVHDRGRASAAVPQRVLHAMWRQPRASPKGVAAGGAGRFDALMSPGPDSNDNWNDDSDDDDDDDDGFGGRGSGGWGSAAGAWAGAAAPAAALAGHQNAAVRPTDWAALAAQLGVPGG